MRRAFVLCALLAAPAAGFAGSEAGRGLDLEVRIEPEAHRIEATARLDVAVPGAGEIAFELHPGLAVSAVEADGAGVPFRTEPASADRKKPAVLVRLDGKGGGVRRLVFRYAGTIHEPPAVARFSRERIADQTEGTIQAEGAFLSSSAAWYPRPVRGASFDRSRVEVRLPPGWEAMVEGSRAAREEGESGTRTVFEGRFPKDGLNLVAGRFRRFEREHGGIAVAAYLFPEDADLAEPYLAAVERYLDLYSAWLGPYAYDRFTVVENFFPTGYGMPGYTLLGREVMKLPFILGTSLGHEVAHNWWGNGVFVDEKGGNWCEGLTTYSADYRYKEMESPRAAAEYRREMARDYTNYVSEPGRDLPLSEFTERSTPATRSIGYGKSMMVFHMLERRLGRERFDAVLRRVYRDHLHRAASWETWRKEFSKEAGEDLGWFFDQWVPRPGAPSLSLGDVSRSEAGSGWIVRGELRQKEGAWRLLVPLAFEGEGKTETRTVEVAGASSEFSVELPFRPERLVADPDQDLFRRLDPAEVPPVLSLLLGDSKTLFVVDDGAEAETVAAYRELAKTLTRTGEGETVEASKVSAASLAGRAVFLLGMPRGEAYDRLLAGLPAEGAAARDRFAVQGVPYATPGAALLAVGRKEGEPSRGVGLFLGLSAESVRAAGRKLVHYGKYSFLAFVDGENRAKGVAAVSGGPLVRVF